MTQEETYPTGWMENWIVAKCLCGAEPIVERRPDANNSSGYEVFKYKCPNCGEKELPWLGQWRDYGALQEWNRIAPKRSYHKRTLEYNEHGVCIAEPYKVFEWRDKRKGFEHLTVEIYLDNGVYYYCRDYCYKNSGGGFGLWIGMSGFPTLEMAKRHAAKTISKNKKELRKIAMELLLPCEQMELF